MENNQTVIENYLKHKQEFNHSKRETGISDKTLYSIRSYLRSLERDINKPFKQATQADILKHLERLRPRSKNQHIVVFREFYRWLYNLDENEPLPSCIRKLKPKRIAIDEIRYRERVVTPEEYTTILEYCDPMQRALFECLWVTGGRKEEVITMHTKDVSYDGQNTRIVLRVSKTNTREVIYPNRAEHLLKWRETLCPVKDNPDAPLFVVLSGGEYHQIWLDYPWGLLNRICKKAGLRHIKTHDFRHSRCTYLLKEGTPESHVKTLLGFDKNTQMLKTYDHNQLSDYQDWLNQKQRATKPTYELLQKQKEELESKHEKQIKALEENIAQIIESLEPYKAVINAEIRKRAVGSAKTMREDRDADAKLRTAGKR